MHKEWHHGTMSAQIIISSPQPLTIKHSHLSQRLFTPACLSHGVIPTAQNIFLPLRPERREDHTYLFTDSFASHCVLTSATHTDRSGVERGSPEGRAHQMTQWLGHSGRVGPRVSKETNCGLSLRLWRMSRGRWEGLHLSDSHSCSLWRKWELVLTGWEEKLVGVGFFVFFFFF